MKNRIELNVDLREVGRGNNRALRVARQVPAVIYGATENANICLHENEVLKYNKRAYENALFNLKCKDSKVNGKVVLMKSVDVHPVTRRPIHVDFFALDMNKSVRVFVEIRTEGKAIGQSEGGLLNIVTRSVEVECLPTAIPEFLTVDISNLGLGMSVHVSDLQTPNGVKMISSPELTIAVVNEAEEENLTPTPAAEAAPAASTPAAGAKADAKAPAAGAKAPAAKK